MICPTSPVPLGSTKSEYQEFRDTFASPDLPSPRHPLPPRFAFQGRPRLAGQHRAQGRPLPLDPAGPVPPLAQTPGVQLVSLQKGYGSEQLEQNKDMNLLEWSDPTDTTAEALVDTAAVMKNSTWSSRWTPASPTGRGPGCPVWVASPLPPNWRWLLDREDTPWYPTMRLFRQKSWTHWPEVIERIAPPSPPNSPTPQPAPQPPPPPDRPSPPPTSAGRQTCRSRLPSSTLTVPLPLLPRSGPAARRGSRPPPSPRTARSHPERHLCPERPVPIPHITPADPPPPLATSRSSRPSPFTSATATDRGCDPAPNVCCTPTPRSRSTAAPAAQVLPPNAPPPPPPPPAPPAHFPRTRPVPFANVAFIMILPKRLRPTQDPRPAHPPRPNFQSSNDPQAATPPYVERSGPTALSASKAGPPLPPLPPGYLGNPPPPPNPAIWAMSRARIR